VARTERVVEVDPATALALRELWSHAAQADGVGAVSEAFRLAVGPPRSGVVHLLRFVDEGGPVGYAQVAEAGTPDAVAELVVDPAHRRRGHGRALLDAALAEGARSVWAHGLLPAADALAGAAGLQMTRTLHRMTRPLTEADAVQVPLPPGFSARAFEPGADDETWVRLNAAAFARHREQGRLTVADLHERMAQPWFDAAGLILVVEDSTGEVVGFHWTKVEEGTGRGPEASADGVREGVGEVYVVGVDPEHQGRGLGGPVTRLGLAHLARRGLGEVELYVDGDNTAARRTYERLGFTDAAVDGQYTLAAT
jgi:mycothiol synthase